MLTTVGFHVPEILFVDVVGKTGTLPLVHIVSEEPKLNVGVTFWLTVTVKVALDRHCPGCGSGVNVYTAEAWLLTVAGLQVPVTPLLDVAGSAGTIPPAQITNEVPKLNTGTVLGVTVTSNGTEFAH